VKELIVDFFSNNAVIIIFMHVFSAIIWIGGMIAIRFGVHYTINNLDDPKVKLPIVIDYLKRFFNIVIPAIIIILITAGILAIGKGFKGTPLYLIVHFKEAIWTIMTINFIFIYLKRNKAQKLIEQNDFKGAKEVLAPIAKWMIPLNIILGTLALFLGIKLNGY